MSSKPYDANNIANYVLRYHENKGHPISNLKLQKELYFLQAEFLVVHDKPLFHNDIAAWDVGPVVPDVYNRFKLFGSASIPLEGDKNLPWDTYWNGTRWNIDTDDLRTINNMLDDLEQYSSVQLMEFTRNQTPWKKAYMFHRNISNKDLKEFFFDDVPKKESSQGKPQNSSKWYPSKCDKKHCKDKNKNEISR